MPDLITKVHHALAGAGVAPTSELALQHQQPAVPVRKSIQPDHLVCLEDGARVTMLKRYLQGRFGLTPNEYRAKWELAPDYPMVAPSYATRRSALAKKLGLGRKRTIPGVDAPATNGASTTKATEGADEQVFPADVADEARTGRHTAESVFGNFGTGPIPEAEDAGEENAPASPSKTPRKHGRKPFAEQSVRATRGRRMPSGG